jgi:iron(III) transport system permease protein
MGVYCAIIAALFLAVLGMAVFASFVKLWPYNFSMSLNHYRMGLVEAASWRLLEQREDGLLVRDGWAPRSSSRPRTCSRRRAASTCGALRAPHGGAAHGRARHGAGPGLHLLLRGSRPIPLHFLYGSMAILVVNTVVHYYTSSHLTAVTALKQIDNEFESVRRRCRCRSGRRSSASPCPSAFP